MVTRINRQNLIEILQKLEAEYIHIEESPTENKIRIYPEIKLIEDKKQDLNELIA